MTVPQGPPRLDLRIDGMHCAGCVSTVETAIRTVPGVQSARVNLATSTASVAISNGEAPVSQILAAVQRAGYRASVQESPERAVAERIALRRAELRRGTVRLTIAALLALPILAAHMLPGPAALHSLAHSGTGLLAQAVLCAAVIAIGAGPMLRGAWSALRNRSGNMDLLVSLGVVVAFVSGVVGAVAGIHELVLFESAAMIVLFVSLGKLLEAIARSRASATLEALLTRLPQTALRVRDGRVEQAPLEDIAAGDVLRIVAPATTPVDGVILSGELALDESMLTGEALPVQRSAGGSVMGGTIAASGSADIRATSTGADCAAARIARLVEQAQAGRAPAQRLADRVAAVFVPIVLGLAVLTAIGWMLAGAGVPAAMVRAVAVLVVACPCAMGLAIPTAVLVGTSSAGARGILIRNIEALEAAAHIDLVMLDKTGTLTAGTPVVSAVSSAAGQDEHELLAIAAGIAAGSTHPLSLSIVREARRRGIEPLVAERHETSAGGGVAAQIGDRAGLLGSADWLRSRGVDVAAEEGWDSVVHVAVDGRWLGRIELADQALPDAAEAIGALRGLEIETAILSGDRTAAVARVAGEFGVGFRAELKPQDKLAEIEKAVKSGRRVAMVGDGINDAPALAAATVGVAIGAGADVASEAADVVLVGRSPRLIAEAIRVSRATVRIMKQNLGWAAGYNIVMLPLAALAPIPPSLATAAMMMSSLSVVGNSLRLRSAAGG